MGDEVSRHDEVNGYVFWGLVALFIGVPELLGGVFEDPQGRHPVADDLRTSSARTSNDVTTGSHSSSLR